MSSQKIVKFNCSVKVRNVDSVDSLTREERQNAWFSSDDLDAIRTRERRLVRKISSNSNKSKNLRRVLMNEIGLETKVDKMERVNRIQNRKYSVLLEQERQWDNDEEPNPEKLARVSSCVSQESLTKAQRRAVDVQEQLRSSNSIFSLGGTQTKKNLLLRGSNSAMGLYTTKFLPNTTTSPKSNQRWRQEISSQDRRKLSPPIRRTSLDRVVQ